MLWNGLPEKASFAFWKAWASVHNLRKAEKSSLQLEAVVVNLWVGHKTKEEEVK